jgi:asparagine synthase (glutamine-hydrolysing)
MEKGDLRSYLDAYCPPVDSTEDMLRADMATYLPDDILTKVDRASMAVSLEIRVPLLDHTLVEFAQRLPIEMKIMGGKGKWPLRNILNRYIDEDLYDRPKTGFGVPIGEWLRGPLKDWADDILAVDRIQRGGYLDAQWVSKRWADHRAGNGNWQYLLWDVLMFESWRDSVDL